MRKSFLITCMLLAATLFAQSPYDSLWYFRPTNQTMYSGINYEKAEDLAKGREAQEIVVAVIDNGVDINHPDLQGKIWVNEDEIPNNGIDDDNNGYIDDINGWNFIGSKDTNVTYDNMELTRQYVILREKYRNTDEAALANDPEYQRYLRIKEDFKTAYDEAKENQKFYEDVVKAFDKIQSKYGDEVDEDEIKKFEPKTYEESIARLFVYIDIITEGECDMQSIKDDWQETLDYFNQQVDYGYNTKFDPREALVGDDYDDSYEKGYGNNQVYISKDFSSHGTHVAGIIAAIRDNEIGAMGICPTAKIMVIRVVPDGDERDKDVANAIIYAVDNGAKIINMSFGKGYAHDQEAVRKAIAYAQEKGVLLVHGAGNDAENNDITDNYPNDFESEFSDVWIEVGASSWRERPAMLADFSNYGRAEVDIFAPGVDIYSTVGDSTYESYDGTSMASPVVAGAAAFIWSYYPELTAAQVKAIIMASAMPIKKKQVIPGEKKKKSKVKKLSVSGGFLDLGKAMEAAALLSKGGSLEDL